VVSIKLMPGSSHFTTLCGLLRMKTNAQTDHSVIYLIR